MGERYRTIKPDYWRSESVCACTIAARYLNLRLWTMADDRGVYPYRPKTIRAEAFPHDPEISEADVEQLLAQLAQNGQLLLFSADDRQWLWCVGWEHQYIQKPTACYPPPPTDNPLFGYKARACVERFVRMGGRDSYIRQGPTTSPSPGRFRGAESNGSNGSRSGAEHITAEVEAMARAIEQTPRSRGKGGQERRLALAARVGQDGLQWVSRALEWIVRDSSTEAARLRATLARWPDGLLRVEQNGETVDRLEEAHRLRDALGFSPADATAPDRPGKPKKSKGQT